MDGSMARSRFTFLSSLVLTMLVAATLPGATASLAAADDVADFYRGKRINFVVGYGTGGGYDIYARLFARFIGCRPHVGIGFGVVREPRQRLIGRPGEADAEVSQLDAGHVLDQSEQVVPVGTIGRRTSYSESPASFQSRASRPACRYR